VELSPRVEYALLALLELASHHTRKEPLKISEITAHQAMPDRYLAAILIMQIEDGASSPWASLHRPQYKPTAL
jgi:DNA-binding IscR family transcriptional regulator